MRSFVVVLVFSFVIGTNWLFCFPHLCWDRFVSGCAYGIHDSSLHGTLFWPLLMGFNTGSISGQIQATVPESLLIVGLPSFRKMRLGGSLYL